MFTMPRRYLPGGLIALAAFGAAIPLVPASAQETARSFDREMAKIEKNRRARAAILISSFGPAQATSVMVKYRKEKAALEAERTEICMRRHGNYDPSDDSYQDGDGRRHRCE